MYMGQYTIGTPLKWTIEVNNPESGEDQFKPIDAFNMPNSVTVTINGSGSQSASIVKVDGTTGVYEAEANLTGVEPNDRLRAILNVEVIEGHTYQAVYEWDATKGLEGIPRVGETHRYERVGGDDNIDDVKIKEV